MKKTKKKEIITNKPQIIKLVQKLTASMGITFGILMVGGGVMLTMTGVGAVLGVPLIILGIAAIAGATVGASVVSNAERKTLEFERQKELIRLTKKK